MADGSSRHNVTGQMSLSNDGNETLVMKTRLQATSEDYSTLNDSTTLQVGSIGLKDVGSRLTVIAGVSLVYAGDAVDPSQACDMVAVTYVMVLADPYIVPQAGEDFGVYFARKKAMAQTRHPYRCSSSLFSALETANSNVSMQYRLYQQFKEDLQVGLFRIINAKVDIQYEDLFPTWLPSIDQSDACLLYVPNTIFRDSANQIFRCSIV